MCTKRIGIYDIMKKIYPREAGERRNDMSFKLPEYHHPDFSLPQFVSAPEVKWELVEKDGFYELETNIYEILGDYSNGIITSDILGKAFEPEQRFEERDESEIIFNVDFYGNHRGVSTIPGPLAK